jgi:hypothetical protein
MKNQILSLILLASGFWPLAAVCHAQAYSSSKAAEAAHIIKPYGGVLMSASGFNNGPAQFISLVDSATVPLPAAAQVTTISFSGVNSASLSGEYLTLNTTTGSYYAWFNYNGAATDPAPAGYTTSISVTCTTSSTAAQIATAFASAASISSVFQATASGSTVTLTNSATGSVSSPTLGTTTSISEGLTTTGVTAALPVITLSVSATSSFTMPVWGSGQAFLNGITIVNSSSLYTITPGSANCFFTGYAQ